MGKVCDIPATEHLRKQLNAGVHGNQDRRPHWNDTEDKESGVGVVGGKRQQYRENRSGCAQQKYVIAAGEPVNPQRNHPGERARQKIKKKKLIAAHLLLDLRTEEKETEHVE